MRILSLRGLWSCEMLCKQPSNGLWIEEWYHDNHHKPDLAWFRSTSNRRKKRKRKLRCNFENELATFMSLFLYISTVCIVQFPQIELLLEMFLRHCHDHFQNEISERIFSVPVIPTTMGMRHRVMLVTYGKTRQNNWGNITIILSLFMCLHAPPILRFISSDAISSSWLSCTCRVKPHFASLKHEMRCLVTWKLYENEVLIFLLYLHQSFEARWKVFLFFFNIVVRCNSHIIIWFYYFRVRLSFYRSSPHRRLYKNGYDTSKGRNRAFRFGLFRIKMDCSETCLVLSFLATNVTGKEGKPWICGTTEGLGGNLVWHLARALRGCYLVYLYSLVHKSKVKTPQIQGATHGLHFSPASLTYHDENL